MRTTIPCQYFHCLPFGAQVRRSFSWHSGDLNPDLRDHVLEGFLDPLLGAPDHVDLRPPGQLPAHPMASSRASPVQPPLADREVLESFALVACCSHRSEIWCQGATL